MGMAIDVVAGAGVVVGGLVGMGIDGVAGAGVVAVVVAGLEVVVVRVGVGVAEEFEVQANGTSSTIISARASSHLR